MGHILMRRDDSVDCSGWPVSALLARGQWRRIGDRLIARNVACNMPVSSPSATPKLILASASPRRRQLMEEAGYAFEVDPSDVPEPEPDPASGTSPAEYASHLAWRKAMTVARRRGTGLI